jgi:hypothetical protein
LNKAHSKPTEIRTEHGPHGEILHLVPYLPAALPPVTKRDLEQAWEAARAAALAAPRTNSTGPNTHGFRFRQAAAPPLDLVLTDTDAANWADAIDAISSLSTAHGISICLRLMALYELMAPRPWAREWFTLSRGGLEFHPALLQAAALSPLTPTGGFAETSLQALLPAANYPADSRQTTPAGSRQTYPAGSRQPLGASRKI